MAVFFLSLRSLRSLLSLHHPLRSVRLFQAAAAVQARGTRPSSPRQFSQSRRDPVPARPRECKPPALPSVARASSCGGLGVSLRRFLNPQMREAVHRRSSDLFCRSSLGRRLHRPVCMRPCCQSPHVQVRAEDRKYVDSAFSISISISLKIRHVLSANTAWSLVASGAVLLRRVF